MANVIDVRRGAAGFKASPQAAKVLRNTYMLLAISLLPTIAGAALGVVFPLIAYFGVVGHIVAFLAAMFGLQYLIVRNRDSTAGVGYMLLFTAAMGYFIGPLLSVALTFSNGVELITMAMGGTAAIFFVLAGYASTTTRDFTAPGLTKVFFIGMIMAFALSMLNVFLLVPALALAISVVFMFIAAAFIVITINSVVRGGETNYIMATMSVYIMLINLFQSLLHLLMIFAGGRD